MIGSGFYSKSGKRIGNIEGAYFEETEFSIADCIQNFIDIEGNSKEIHFDRFKE